MKNIGWFKLEKKIQYTRPRLKHQQRLLSCWALIVGYIMLLIFSGSVYAERAQTQPETLAEKDKVNVDLRAWVDDSSNDVPTFSVYQQVILYVDVGTSRWFTGGTRIGAVEVPDLIAKQRNQLATNYTERHSGKTWSRQRWEITLYPQVAKNFVIPPIAVNVQVSAPDGTNVTTTLYTQPIRFKTILPSGEIKQDRPWFSASQVAVTQQWLRSNQAVDNHSSEERHLRVGDAITRTITIVADNSLSILLPDVMTQLEHSEQFQAYPQPNTFTDTQTRGEYRSSRKEQVVYILQQGGEVNFPNLELQWWNTDKQQLERIEIEGAQYHVRHTLKSFLRAYAHLFLSVFAMLVFVMIGIVMTRRYYTSHPKPNWLVLRKLIKQGKWGTARAVIYSQLRRETKNLQIAQWHIDRQVQSEHRVRDHDVSRFLDGEENASIFTRLSNAIQYSKNRKVRLAGLKVPEALPQLKNPAQFKSQGDDKTPSK